ncbi:MAG: hypothetical protein A2068_12790 [Ignavibacteria bacterium GWB2_35_6b]|nr:MAG: hypothetical protein A2068_12790 [Ignavibacteria bacterium GWB2_35_6b]
MKNSFLNRLSVKLILIISASLLSILILQTILAVSTLRHDLISAFAQNTYRFSEIIKNATLYEMKENNKNDINEIVKHIGKDKGLEAVRIYDKSGTIVYSVDSTEINFDVAINSSTCNPCHASAKPMEKLSIDDRLKFEEDESGNRFLVLLNPIENSVDCYTAECHAHDNSVKVLGVLEVKVSLANIDAIVESNVKSVVEHSIYGTIFIAVLIGFLITIFVNRPIKKINAGIEELSKGNLDYKISLNSKDELGHVAIQFNDMSSKLDKAYNEIKDWNETLNIKINEKTEELKSVYDQVIQIEKLASLGKLSATVAHELNNPLEGILTYTKLIGKKLRKEQKENEFYSILNFLDLISEESARCGKIVKDLLVFSHRDSDEMTETDLINIIEKSATMINHHLELHKIKLIKDFEKDYLPIKCSSQKIQQALMSLLINSVEAMNDGGKILIKVSVEKYSAVIRIIDEGCGISEKALSNIFEPFFTTKNEKSGTGLGLSVAYGIVQAHKGKIEVEETSPGGTTFKVSLPLTNL